MSNFLKSGSTNIYSGDVVYLRCRDGQYLKWDPKAFPDIINGHRPGLIVDGRTKDVDREFVIEVTGKNKIRLLNKNTHYCRSFEQPGFLTSAKLTLVLVDGKSPGPESEFKLIQNGGYFAFQTENGQYWNAVKGANGNDVVAGAAGVGYDTGYFVIEKKDAPPHATETLVGLEFNEAKISEHNIPEVIFKEEISNDTSAMQPSTLQFSEIVTLEDSWDISASASLSYEKTIKIPVPKAMETKMGFAVTTTFKIGHGEKRTKEVKFTESINCPPGKRIEATAYIMRGYFDIPFKATIERRVQDANGREYVYTYSEKGVFKRANVNFHHRELKEFDLPHDDNN